MSREGEVVTLRKRRSEQAASITDVDIEKYRDIFKILDKNGSNRISLAEFGEVLNCLGQIGQDTSEDELKAVFNEMDSAKSGGINVKDFAKLMKSFEPTKTNQEEEYRQVFQLLDSDNDGLISTQDLTKVLQPLGVGQRTSLDSILEMIHLADEDGLGKMDVKQFLEIMMGQDE